MVSRARLPRAQLVRLSLGVDGLVHVDPKAIGGGRGAWVSPSREALQRVCDRPGLLSRALRQKNPQTADLLAEAQAALESRLLLQLRAAYRSGRARFDPGVEGAVLQVLSIDGDEDGSPGSIPSLRLALDRQTLGGALRRDAVSRLALLPCRATRMLLASLQEATSLGYPAR